MDARAIMWIRDKLMDIRGLDEKVMNGIDIEELDESTRLIGEMKKRWIGWIYEGLRE